MIHNTPNGLPEIISVFGNPDHKSFYRDQIRLMTLPFPLLYLGKTEVKRTQVHRLAAENFQAALEAIRERGLADRFKEYGGIYENRTIKGSKKFLSLHAFGIAGDWLMSKYPLGSKKRMPAEIVRCFTRVGFVYGGDFQHRKDPMHFQLARGY